MEEAKGVQLENTWNSNSIFEKTNVVTSLIEIEKKLLSVSFTRYVGETVFEEYNVK